MKKSVWLFMAFFVIFGCTSKKSTKKILKGWDAYEYTQAKELTVAGKNKRTFDSTKAEIYFIAQWNTPSYYSYNSEFTGIAYDGGTFMGVQKGDSVYFLFDRKITSDDFIAQTGDSIITIEVRIHKNGVSKDPRKTCWWIAAIQNDHVKNLDEFLENAIAIPDKDKEILSPCVKALKENLNKIKGSPKQKIINFTAKSVNGSPKSWDAWTWPGYYTPACPGFISIFAKYAEHQNDVAVVEL